MKNDVVPILMIQGISDDGDLITHVACDYMYRKYQSVHHFVPYGTIVRPIAKFQVKYRLPKKGIFERKESYINRIENLLHTHLEIYNRNGL